ncbi:hypothetical protein PABY_18630 [Pyrodictium abyssi]|uniref:Uncharacterized protein n=1 Tax=Pyrodictium abyssi TaxID=54256 RepID=A0ABN6ZVB9_9CREN|nr:hypothetical protein PABY_18630 [Pyrodictium abyssi]
MGPTGPRTLCTTARRPNNQNHSNPFSHQVARTSDTMAYAVQAPRVGAEAPLDAPLACQDKRLLLYKRAIGQLMLRRYTLYRIPP